MLMLDKLSNEVKALMKKMCETDDLKELDTIHGYAINRLDTLRSYRRNELSKEGFLYLDEDEDMLKF